MNDILDLSVEQLSEFLVEHGISKYKTKQIFDWIYKKKVCSFEEMTNLSKTDRAFLDYWR